MTKENFTFLGAGEGQPSIWIGEGDVQHFMILGHTGRGKSAVLQAEALRRGVSYAELLKELEPTEEQKEGARMQEQVEETRKAKRLAAICESYWQSSSEGDFYSLHDALVSTLMVGAKVGPNADQLKALFMMLPARIIGLGIALGFGDTEVGDDIYSFIEENRGAVAAQLGLQSPPENP